MSIKKIAPSTKTGAHHWLLQRISAVALIPLILWLVISVLRIADDPEGYIPVFFAYPLNAILGITFITTSLYHGSIGIRVIIEDYISNKVMMHFVIMLVHFISILTAIAGILAIIKLHLIG